jgi:hypothetical protein
MDWLLSIITWLMGIGMGLSLSYLYRRRAARLAASKPSFRRLAEPTEDRNVTRAAEAEDRPSARQSQARFHPRSRATSTTKKVS